jgi:S-(hydroxymethyl)glutathione dehydrogenase/alcohol dehydrogenase
MAMKVPSRRRALKTAAVAFGGGAAMLAGGRVEAAQAPALVSSTNVAGRPFRGFVLQGTTGSVRELRLRAIGPRQVLIRTEAVVCSYTRTRLILGTNNVAQATLPGVGGVGVVEAVGSEVRRVRVGDRVVNPAAPQCGVCYNCMRGLANNCMAGRLQANDPIADLVDDGSPVTGGTGFAEVMVDYEENCVPVFTDLPAALLAPMQTTALCGLSATVNRAPVQMGSDVAVFGAGAIGLSMIQGARIRGASRIVSIEPIPARRELALKVGATHVLDPNAEGNSLVQRVLAICASKSNRILAGYGNAGPDYVFEAVGGDVLPARIPGPDPTGVLPLQQAWQLCPPTGYVVTVGVGHPPGAIVSFPAGQWSNGSKRHLGGNMAGANALRDVPTYIRLMETGQFDMRSIVGNNTFPLDRIKEVYQRVADRTMLGTAVIVFS